MLVDRSFFAMGVSNQVVSNDSTIDEAFQTVRDFIEQFDNTCSRFKEDSELTSLNQHAGLGPQSVSPMLWEALDIALEAAAATDGLVDPTVGSCLLDIGYTVTFTELAKGVTTVKEAHFRPPAGWRTVSRDHKKQTIAIPAGVALDLGATGKAFAADRAAALAADAVGAGVMVNCGGDVSCAGVPPSDGWRVRVAENETSPQFEDVLMFDGGIATSSPSSREWTREDRTFHHLIDPRTGGPAKSEWRVVSVIASTCVKANAAATAAIVLGDQSLPWLEGLAIPVRLVGHDGPIYRVGGWPQ